LIEQHVVQALAEVVGPKYVSTEREICQAYSKDPAPNITLRLMRKDPLCVPEGVIMPSTTEEVQAIMRIANRYGVKIIVLGSGDNLTGLCIPSRTKSMIMDLRRMDKILEIDEENQIARFQPFVSYCRLQAETMKRGLWNGGTPAAPSSNAIIANTLAYGGDWQTSNAYGLGTRSILSMTIVLANGEILRTGSHGMNPGDGTFWYGPGPDVKCIFEILSCGALGVITEVVWKLHTWTSGDWPIEETYGRPPVPKNHRCFWFRFDDNETATKVCHEICYSGIALGVNLTMRSVNSFVGETHQAESTKKYDSGYYEPHWLYVMLEGYSKGQLEYEEKVLHDIVKEIGGEKLDQERRDIMSAYNFDCFRSGDFVRWARPGIYSITGFGRGYVQDRAKVHNFQQQTVKKFLDKGIMNANTTWPWYYAYERGYFWLDERDLYGDQIRDSVYCAQMAGELGKGLVDGGIGYLALFEPFVHWHSSRVGPNFGNLVRMAKRVFDPKDTLNPDKLVFFSPPEKKEAPAEKK
jgi:hypothetical protein